MNRITRSSKVYIDTNIFISLFELVPYFYETAKEVFELLHFLECRILTNEITIAECIYKPARQDDFAMLQTYQELFASDTNIGLLPLNSELANRAASHGGKLGLKLIDAIHFTSAIEAGCDFFITSDKAFTSTPEIEVILIKPAQN